MARAITSIAPWADEVVETPGPVSIEELERRSDDSCCYELVEGLLVKLSPGGGGHRSLSLDLATDGPSQKETCVSAGLTVRAAPSATSRAWMMTFSSCRRRSDSSAGMYYSQEPGCGATWPHSGSFVNT